MALPLSNPKTTPLLSLLNRDKITRAERPGAFSHFVAQKKIQALVNFFLAYERGGLDKIVKRVYNRSVMREIRFRAWIPSRKVMGTTFELKQRINEMAGWFAEEAIFMQYTGLKDKTGKAIYEGDIIDWRGQYSEDAPQPIVWYYTGWYVGYTGKKMCITSLNAIEPKHIEVMGNIYENPELLKER